MRRAFYAILLIVGIGLMVMPLSVPVMKSNAKYSVLNTGPRGVSSFGRLLYSRGEIFPLLSTYDSSGLGGKRGTLLVIGPNLAFTDEEVGELKVFLEGGNTLILADDFGTGNALLSALGVKERFSKGEVISPIYREASGSVMTSNVLLPELQKGVEVVVTLRPSAVLNPSKPLVLFPNASLLNGKYGAFTLVDEVSYGSGRIILVSDPDLFTNALFKDNEAFINNLLDYATGPFYIDEAHHSDFNPYTSGTITIKRVVNKEHVFYYVLFVAFVVFIIESGLWLLLLEKMRSLLFFFVKEEKMELEEIVKSLEEEGLDGEVLRKIIREIETGSKLGDAHGR
ncbi:DUF4350 domain-containing protein [Palaeococcus ferrophilus]|uniref:DUF4350 domain-containing protein n=1 Tax=Palaeococcus ferrophilus TaxID=83868 RepID=UPI00064F9C9C|nr:DUF4350 domain-containing protein [Palaeococcus ferrophilus]